MAVKFKHVNFTYSPKSPFEHDALFDINLEIDKIRLLLLLVIQAAAKTLLYSI